mgnify:CR=1 FL=1
MLTTFKHHCWILLLGLLLALSGCSDNASKPLLSDQYAKQASIDRFSEAAGTLFQRSSNPDLPGPNEPINFDAEPFITKGLGPNGQVIEYYHFDVMPRQPAPLYVLFRKNENTPVDQPNIVDVIPGDKGYNDFWQVHRVIVPSSYEANSATSLAEIQEAGYEIQPTPRIVNCPIVPKGSTAKKRLGSGNNSLHRGWYKNKVVYYFTFEEKALSLTSYGHTPISLMYVSFNVNPGKDGGGFPSGYKTETGSMLTHNIAATTPVDSTYSPLWQLNIYDNADFQMVTDLSSARDANILQNNVAIVNRPLVHTTQP